MTAKKEIKIYRTEKIKAYMSFIEVTEDGTLRARGIVADPGEDIAKALKGREIYNLYLHPDKETMLDQIDLSNEALDTAAGRGIWDDPEKITELSSFEIEETIYDYEGDPIWDYDYEDIKKSIRQWAQKCNKAISSMGEKDV